MVEQTIWADVRESWALICGNFTSGSTREDPEVLGRLAKIMAVVDVPVIAAASPSLLGCDSFATIPDPDDWRSIMEESEKAILQALHKLPESANLGLYLTRFLLRLPYGEKTDPLEQLDFEKIVGKPPGIMNIYGIS